MFSKRLSFLNLTLACIWGYLYILYLFLGTIWYIYLVCVCPVLTSQRLLKKVSFHRPLMPSVIVALQILKWDGKPQPTYSDNKRKQEYKSSNFLNAHFFSLPSLVTNTAFDIFSLFQVMTEVCTMHSAMIYLKKYE